MRFEGNQQLMRMTKDQHLRLPRKIKVKKTARNKPISNGKSKTLDYYHLICALLTNGSW